MLKWSIVAIKTQFQQTRGHIKDELYLRQVVTNNSEQSTGELSQGRGNSQPSRVLKSATLEEQYMWSAITCWNHFPCNTRVLLSVQILSPLGLVRIEAFFFFS